MNIAERITAGLKWIDWDDGVLLLSIATLHTPCASGYFTCINEMYFQRLRKEKKQGSMDEPRYI
jgi:hypothetical protein